jgi:hypothetical protein
MGHGDQNAIKGCGTGHLINCVIYSVVFSSCEMCLVSSYTEIYLLQNKLHWAEWNQTMKGCGFSEKFLNFLVISWDCMVQGRYLEVERDKEGFRDWKMLHM